LIILTACHRLHLFPKRGCWGGFDKKLFHEMLRFGSGLFVLNLGMQLVSASQTIIISRTLGLENTSVWTVATKLSSMMQLFVNRIFETSAAGLLEMKVRGEIPTLRARSRDLITLTCVIAGIGAAGLAFFNSAFLDLWTQGKIRWAPANDYLLGAVVLASCSARFHTGLASLGKDVHKVKYVCLLEGVAFVTLSFLFAGRFGLTGILVSSMISGIFVNLLLTLRINSQRLGVTFSQILGWMWKPWMLTAVLLLLHHLFVPPAARNTHGLLDFAAQIAIFIAVILPAYWFFGIPSALRQELGAMIFKVIARVKAMRSTVR
jgi:O-antigen/teichoic acid export membrane protein